MGVAITALVAIIVVILLASFARLLVELLVRVALGLFLAAGVGLASGIISAERGGEGLFVGILFSFLALVPCIVLGAGGPPGSLELRWRKAQRWICRPKSR